MRLRVRVASIVSLASSLLCSSVAGQSPAPTLFAPSNAPVHWVEAAGLHSTHPPPDFAQELGPNRLRGALWGGGVGLVAGGLLGGLSVSSDEGDDGFGGSLAEGAATGEAVILGAIVGAGIGAIIGATWLAPARR